jgi:hypothetical protein
MLLLGGDQNTIILMQAMLAAQADYRAEQDNIVEEVRAHLPPVLHDIIVGYVFDPSITRPPTEKEEEEEEAQEEEEEEAQEEEAEADEEEEENVEEENDMDPLFYYWFAEFAMRSADVVQEATRQYAQHGRGAFYCDVPFQCSTQFSSHDLRCGYMPSAAVDSAEYPDGSSMVADYDPSCETVVLLSVTIRRSQGKKSLNNAFFRAALLGKDSHIGFAQYPGSLPGPLGSPSPEHRRRRYFVVAPGTEALFLLTCTHPGLNPRTPGAHEHDEQCHFCSKTKGTSTEGLVVLLKCSRCRAASYCSTECQRAHYRAHRSFCRQFEGVKLLARAAIRAHPK